MKSSGREERQNVKDLVGREEEFEEYGGGIGCVGG